MPILGLKSKGPTTPAHFALEPLIRPNILSLVPYRAARDDYSDGVLLDANENAYGPSLAADFGKLASTDAGAATLNLLSEAERAVLNRYPSPTHDDLKRRIAALRNLPNEDWVFLGVGSDEVIDMLYRVLCVPGKDAAITTPPTYGMYAVSAQINDVGVVKVPLVLEDGAFQLDEEKLDAAFKATPNAKLLFICSPGNPTGTLIPLDAIKRIASNPNFKGVIVVDEAYIDFAPEGTSAVTLVKEYANIAVSQTLSKSFGLAAIRLGYLLASPELIQILTNAKAPYNVSLPTASLALASVSESGLAVMQKNTATLVANRTALIDGLLKIPAIGRVPGGNHANFVLAEVLDKPGGKPDNARANAIYKEMAENRGVVVRFRGNEPGCLACLRITVGTEEENATALARLSELLQ
ncbi:Histidinol-phosphate aminotransferase [Vanrija pseudolonga]|uniref:histidinol-phosphate transaminase n=1 Tax=Vanrija pseudolonga TaxID=143232 RepID=A0AAF0Y9P8_9TREE|nr:Histidinol-phosphate aminotransferase [Vanrija pseudolonga]